MDGLCPDFVSVTSQGLELKWGSASLGFALSSEAGVLILVNRTCNTRYRLAVGESFSSVRGAKRRKESAFRDYIASWHPKRLTWNLFVDVVIGSSPAGLDWMFGLHLRLEIFNLRNDRVLPRNYCSKAGEWRTGNCRQGRGDELGCPDAFKIVPPTPRQFNMEIAGSWTFSGFQFEVAIRVEWNKEFATGSVAARLDLLAQA